MFAKDKKNNLTSQLGGLKKKALDKAQDLAIAKATSTLSASTQQALATAQTAQQGLSQASSMASQASSLIPGGGFAGGINNDDVPGLTFSEGLAKNKAYAQLLDSLLGAASPSGLVFTCQIAGLPESTFQVTEFNLNEGLSRLFSLSISAVTTLPFIDFQSLLGVASSLTVKRNGKEIRTVRGILAGAVQGNTDGVKTWYHFDIRPEMWVMTLNQDSRIFQHKKVPEILKTLLEEAHIKADSKFYRDDLHQKRPYTTQKRESAYAFWCRLAFEEGINFWFEENQLFYSDEHMGMTAGIHLTYNPQAESDITDSTATTWQYGEYLCVDETIQKDNNFIRPSYPLAHQAKLEKGGQHSVFESYGRFQEDAQAAPFTAIRFEQLRNGSRVGRASTNCFALMPGKIFSLSNHPSLMMNDNWQVIQVSHHGVQPLADNSGGEGTQLSNSVEFIPGTQEWRPPHHYKPTADGDEVATVVGPPGEEIYVNEVGAVKVYFHWDRYGKPDHSASCWVRVAMGWNGNGYGFSAVPRIGQEVIVSYLNGDIDRPIITGGTYNGRNAPPLKFPENMTRTTIKTKTHKGDGFNELRFEDAGGKQEIFIHAQKDMNTTVLNDQSLTVFQNKTKNVGGNESNTIEGVENTKVVIKQDIAIKGNSSLLTGGYRTDQAVGQYFIGSGECIRLECGESVLELSASGAINLKGKSFNITVDNGGEINTVGGVLGLNPSTPSPCVSVNGIGDKSSLQTAIDNIFSSEGK
ncbi:type VI secretion system tip protein VgrG [Proteus sp. GOKU]|uniref:type VI secretion system Vgr family protein n=1 Tax=Proteus TaxID=583 RepID=UPI001892C712|nr:MULTISPECIES: type VI secretion system tip protein TssI/VgrG [Proteus]QPB81455.1 type VI secretion system tip protein VgrG [Proteus sp. GOKU]QQP27462.1 type VI secretion system tip protein VgrG [Proteus vulgaris]